mmetsp:Transcript_39692/g.60825  ORF Transcript_39692/g.60825 Transcript_39692/m.60825 type:complete len:329 (+) Transcript_39692:107-1093(+)
MEVEASHRMTEFGGTYEDAINIIGGFGKFQWISSLILIFSFNTSGAIFYSLPFLTVYPDYECLEGGVWVECDRQTDICDPNLPKDEWRINYDSPDSFRNFVDPDKLDLTCTKAATIGFIGTAYFIGLAISCSFIPLIADRVGRKRPLIFCMIMQTTAYLGIILSHNVHFTTAMFFFVGFFNGGLMGILPNYMNEFVPNKYQNTVTTALNSIDSLVTAYEAVYFYFTRNWLPVHLTNFFGAILLIFLVLIIIPESPKYYYTWKKHKEARQCLTRVASVNGKKDNVEKIVFDNELPTFGHNSRYTHTNITNTMVSVHQSQKQLKESTSQS